MIPYQTGIPTGTVPLNQDYLNLQQNCNSLAQQFEKDHVPLTSVSGDPPNGYHTVVHLVTQMSNPAVSASAGQLFTKSVNSGGATDVALYYQTAGGLITQITNNFVPTISANGQTFLPGGLILKWGVYNAPAGDSGAVTFSPAFPSNCYGVTFATDRTSTSSENYSVYLKGPPTKTGFATNSGLSGSHNIYWMAIGN